MKIAMDTFFSDVRRRYSTPDIIPSPPEAAEKFQGTVGLRGEDCNQVCGREGLRELSLADVEGLTCRTDLVKHVNLCKAVEDVFTCSQGCSNSFYGQDLPAMDVTRDQCLVNAKLAEFPFDCVAKHENTRRLCPCGRKL